MHFIVELVETIVRAPATRQTFALPTAGIWACPQVQALEQASREYLRVLRLPMVSGTAVQGKDRAPHEKGQRPLGTLTSLWWSIGDSNP